MKKNNFYLKAALYHIRKNKTYSSFNIIGIALTFLFINIILQVVYSQIANIPPNMNTERIISLNDLGNINNNSLLFTSLDAYSIASEIKGHEAVSLSQNRVHKISINEKVHYMQCCFANSELWDVKQFQLLKGRFFTQEECENKTPVALVRESIAKKLFVEPVLGKNLKIRTTEFKIIGIIKDYAFRMDQEGMPSAFWVPYTFAKWDRWRVEILFPHNMKIETAKQMTAKSLNYFYQKKGEESTLSSDNISTVKEVSKKRIEAVLIVFSSAIIFLLLLIPAINMLTLNLAGMNNRASELAIQRAFGASKTSVFVQIMIENVLMTISGAIIGICLSYPFILCVDKYLIPPSIEGISLTIGVSIPILLFGVLPLTLLLSLISAGLPAYITAKQNIVEILKGGSKC